MCGGLMNGRRALRRSVQPIWKALLVVALTGIGCPARHSRVRGNPWLPKRRMLLNASSSKDSHASHLFVLRYFIHAPCRRVRGAKNNVADNHIAQEGACKNIRREVGKKRDPRDADDAGRRVSRPRRPTVMAVADCENSSDRDGRNHVARRKAARPAVPGAFILKPRIPEVLVVMHILRANTPVNTLKSLG